jgi:hypothetical protein
MFMRLSKIQGIDGSDIWVQYNEEENDDLHAVGFIDDIAKRTEKFNQTMVSTVKNYSRLVVSSVKEGLNDIGDPESIALEFGIQLGGETGIPFVTKGSAEANVKVSVTWKMK